MTRRLCCFVPFAAALLFSATLPARDLRAQEPDADYGWFDQLGFPDPSELAFVRVATGGWTQYDDSPPENTFYHGFLIQDDGKRFKVLTLDLQQQDNQRTADTVQPHEHVGFEAADFPKHIREQLKKLSGRGEDRTRFTFSRLSPANELFVLSWFCAKRGRDALAKELFAESLKQPGANGQPPGSYAKLRIELAEELSRDQIWRAIRDFGDPEISRKQLLIRLRDFPKRFPKSEHVNRAVEAAKLLETMVREDDERAAAPPLAKPTLEQRIADLVFQLRDQNGHQFSQPGSCDIFLDPRGEKSPAHQLLAIGLDAVPQLIEAIDDRRFTRSVGFHRNFYFSHHVLRVGDAAVTILSRISGKRFYVRTTTNSAMLKDGEESQTKRAIRAWWKEVQSRGFKAVLAEGVAAGGSDAAYQAEHLRKRFPDAALAAIDKGLLRTKDSWARSALLNVAVELKDEGATELLKREMERAPALETRVVAAFGLANRKQPEAIPAMIKEWNLLNKSSASPEGAFGDGSESLIHFLRRCGNVDAMRALTANFQRHPVDRRLNIVMSMSGEAHFGFYGGNLEHVDEATINSKPIRDIAEAFLVQAMLDTEAREGMSMGIGENGFSDPRICDVAAYIAGDMWPEKYVFTPGASFGERDRERYQIINSFRRERGLPALPVPSLKPIAKLPDRVTSNALDDIVNAVDKESRAAAVKQYEQLGLPGLAPLNARRGKLSKDHIAAPQLTQLAARLNSLVREVSFATKSVAPDKQLRSRIKGLLNQRLTGSKLMQLLIETMKSPPEEVVGIRAIARRDDEASGVVLELELLRRADVGRTSNGWRMLTRLRVGREERLGSTSYSSGDSVLNLSNHQEFVGPFDEALAESPEKPIYTRLAIIRDE